MAILDIYWQATIVNWHFNAVALHPLVPLVPVRPLVLCDIDLQGYSVNTDYGVNI